MLTAWVANGKMFRTHPFIFAAGMRHSAASRLISFHSARRNSPEGTNNMGESFMVQFVMNQPS
jgi:hypothetical protein